MKSKPKIILGLKVFFFSDFFAEIWVMWIDCILDEGNHSTSLQIKLKRKTRRNKLKAEVESLIVISY